MTSLLTIGLRCTLLINSVIFPVRVSVILVWNVFILGVNSSHLFSPFAAVCLCGVSDLAETFPSLTASGPFLSDAPVFHVPPDRILPPQLWSFSRALPLHLHFDNCSDVLGFVSYFDVSKQTDRQTDKVIY